MSEQISQSGGHSNLANFETQLTQYVSFDVTTVSPCQCSEAPSEAV